MKRGVEARELVQKHKKKTIKNLLISYLYCSFVYTQMTPEKGFEKTQLIVYGKASSYIFIDNYLLHYRYLGTN